MNEIQMWVEIQRGSYGGVGVSKPPSFTGVSTQKTLDKELTELVFEFEPKFVLITTLVFCKVDGHREVI